MGEKHQKAPCFWCSAQQFGHIVAIFEPVVGDFFEHFSSQGFFDSLVGWLVIQYMKTRTHIAFNFYKFRDCKGKSDIIKILNVLLENGLTLATRQLEGKSAPKVIKYNGTPDEYLNEKSWDVDLKDSKDIPLIKRRGPFRFSGTGLIENAYVSGRQVFLSVGFDMFGKDFNIFQGSLITSEELFEEHTKLLYKITIDLYQAFHPAFGHLDYAFLGGNSFFEEYPTYKTKSLYWTTFFGSDFIKKYGMEYFTKSPVWKKVTFPDGGMLLQLSEKLKPPKDYVALDKIKEYFSPIGVNYITYPNINLYDW